MKESTKGESLLEDITNLKNSGIELYFREISKDENDEKRESGEIKVALYSLRKIIIAPNVSGKGIHLFCQYSEYQTPPHHTGPRLMYLSPMGLKMSCVKLSNEMEYIICRKHSSQVSGLHSDMKRILEEGKVFDFQNLKI